MHCTTPKRNPFFFLLLSRTLYEYRFPLNLIFFQRDLGKHTLHFKMDWDTCSRRNEGALRGSCNGPCQEKSQAGEAEQERYQNSSECRRRQKLSQKNLTVMICCVHPNVACASCLSLYHQAAEATPSCLTIKYNKKRKPKILKFLSF